MLNYANTEDSPRCGEIWICNLITKNGSVQNGHRPVLILSNNQNNIHSTTLNVIPITTKKRKRKLPIHVELESYRQYGLSFSSTLLIEQITTISRENLEKRIGKIEDSKTLGNIKDAIAIQFPILNTI